MSVLTLVENAVRHGIDPSENGGRIDVGARREARRRDPRRRRRHRRRHGRSAVPGTGLVQPREPAARLLRAPVRLELHEARPHGLRAEIVFRRRDAERSTARRRSAPGRLSNDPGDRADRRRRAAPARAAARPPGPALAGARDRRRGAQRARGDRAVRGLPAEDRLPRRAHARPERHRRGAGDRPARRDRVRHRARALRRAGVRAGRDRLRRQAVRGSPPGRFGGAPEGAAGPRRSRCRRLRGGARQAGRRAEGAAPPSGRSTCNGSALRWRRACA